MYIGVESVNQEVGSLLQLETSKYLAQLMKYIRSKIWALSILFSFSVWLFLEKYNLKMDMKIYLEE